MAQNETISNRPRGCTGFDNPAGITREQFLKRFGMGLGAMALSSTLSDLTGGAAARGDGVRGPTQRPRKIKRVIYQFKTGGPT
ncbi:MAG: hypothetical protein VX304_15150, partial [Planctomycetota bacterium]|nr:hypothetical protein [Planctomycetota bacterium]